jgi:hypothetical protein
MHFAGDSPTTLLVCHLTSQSPTSVRWRNQHVSWNQKLITVARFSAAEKWKAEEQRILKQRHDLKQTLAREVETSELVSLRAAHDLRMDMGTRESEREEQSMQRKLRLEDEWENHQLELTKKLNEIAMKREKDVMDCQAAALKKQLKAQQGLMKSQGLCSQKPNERDIQRIA